MDWLDLLIKNWAAAAVAIVSAIAAAVSARTSVSNARSARRSADAAERQVQLLTQRKEPSIECIVEPVLPRPAWRILTFRVGNNEVVALRLRQVTIQSPHVDRLESQTDVTVLADLASDALDVVEQRAQKSGDAVAADFDLRMQPVNDPRPWSHSGGDGRIRDIKAYAHLTAPVAAGGQSVVAHAVATFSWADRGASSFPVEFTIEFTSSTV